MDDQPTITPHPVEPLVIVIRDAATLREAIAVEDAPVGSTMVVDLIERARLMVEEHAPAGNAWEALVAIQRRFGKVATIAYCLGTDMPAMMIADVVAGAALAARSAADDASTTAEGAT